jgi:hypothetical protein
MVQQYTAHKGAKKNLPLLGSDEFPLLRFSVHLWLVGFAYYFKMSRDRFVELYRSISLGSGSGCLRVSNIFSPKVEIFSKFF